MDSVRLLLWGALGLVLILAWEAWQRDYGPRPQPATSPATQQGEAASGAGPTARPADVPEESAVPEAPEAAAPAGPGTATRGLPSAGRVRVETDVVRAELDLRGGDLRRLDLLRYPVTVDRPDEPFRLMDDAGPHLYVAQSGLLGPQGRAPTHHARLRADAERYRLADGQKTLVVPLVWEGPDGLRVEKRYVFRRGDYLVRIEQRVINRSGEPWRGRAYFQLQRGAAADPSTSRFLYTYLGAAYYTPEERYEKLPFDELAERPLARDVRGGWVAMVQHYFLGAWIPPEAQTVRLYSRVLDGPRYVVGLVTPPQEAPPGGEAVFAAELWAGPKLQERLSEVAEGLELTVDYGILTVLAKPLFWLLKLIHGVVGNWGWAIVLLTLLIKLAFYKLSETSYRSMAKMKKLAPRLQALKERYGDDKQRLNQAMMELYRKEKINPLGGCLPILVQIPVFIALYWVLLESVELRQAPFLLWIRDLSTPDPYYVLPVLMGLSMFVQQRLNPMPMDPVQAKVMMALPVVFTIFFAFFPSGLVLYWLTNNVLSIAQQWVINRRLGAA